MGKFSSDAIYFPREGKENLMDCLTASFAAVNRHGLDKLVIFTAKGDGLEAALFMKAARSELHHVKLVGVTFPQGKVFAEREGEQPPTQFSPELIRKLRESETPLVRARLPFDPIWSTYPTNTILAQDMTIIGNALNAFGGGMSLCFQAVLMACDSGEVDWGEHIVVMTADTALLVKAAPTDHFLTDLIVREILCKPVFLTISRKEDPGSLMADADEEPDSPDGDLNLLGAPEE
jgi:hypothetical protein